MAIKLFGHFWPALLAIVVVAVIGATSVFRDVRSFWFATAGIVTVTGGVCLAIALREASNPLANRLTRDVVAFALLGAIAPLLVSATSRFFFRRDVWLRTSASLLVGLVPIYLSPLILLAVHCSSGDCL